MLTAFIYSEDGSSQKVEGVDAVREAWQRPGIRLWVDVEGPEENEMLALGGIFELDPESINDTLYGDPWPRIDDLDKYIFLVLYGLFGLKEKDELDPHKLAVYCGPRFLITIHNQPLLTVRQVRARCARHPESVLARGVDYTLCTIIDTMVDNYLRVADRYEERLNVLEERSYQRDVDDELLAELSEVRRGLLELRQLAMSQRELMGPLVRGEFDFIADSLSQQFLHVRDHLSQVLETVNGLRELMGGVYQNYHAVLTGRTNEIVKVLTIYAGILLPLTLVAGIYGMNLPVWPSSKSPWSFWIVLVFMVGLTGFLYFHFRRRKWL